MFSVLHTCKSTILGLLFVFGFFFLHIIDKIKHQLIIFLQKQSLVAALIWIPQLDERSGSVQCDVFRGLSSNISKPHVAIKKTRDHWPWDDDVGAQVLRAGFGLTEVVLLLHLDQYSPACFITPLHRPRNKRLLAGRPDITSGHFHIPPLTSLSHEFLYFLAVDGRVCSSWCLAWQHHTETELSALHFRIHAAGRTLDIFNLHQPSGYLDCKLLLWTAEYAGEVNITIMFLLIRQR